MAEQLTHNKSIYVAGIFADITSLKALDTTDLPAHIWVYVEDVDTGEYYLEPSSSAAESLPNIVAPTTGTGRWIKKNGALVSDYSLVKQLAASTGATYTASNGLSLSSDVFKLGGTLTEDTTIEGNQKTLAINNLNSTHGFSVGSTNGTYTNYLSITTDTDGAYLQSYDSSSSNQAKIGIPSSGNIKLQVWSGAGDSTAINLAPTEINFITYISLAVQEVSLNANGFGIKTDAYSAYLKTTSLGDNRTFQFPDASGTLALTSDFSQFWSVNGNTTGGTTNIGTNDNYGMHFIQNGSVIGGYDNNKQWFFGRGAAYSNTLIGITAPGNDDGTMPLIINDSDENTILCITSGKKIGHGCVPHGRYQFSLSDDDTNYNYISGWDNRHLAISYGNSGNGPGLGISYSNADNAVNLGFITPGVAWLNVRSTLRSFGLYSETGDIGFSQGPGTSIALGPPTFGGGERVFSIQNAIHTPTSNPSGGSILYCEDGGIGSHLCVLNEAGDTMRFYKESALTSQLSTITYTVPGTADYTIQNLTNSGGYGFATQDEGNSVLAVIANLQTRIHELESKLQNMGFLA
ncbi:MAG TPA: hypothetical protein VNB90_10735 [Cytophagaceae bacterium]|nr:hypothetical protein [Cytophagaceae bacterium]